MPSDQVTALLGSSAHRPTPGPNSLYYSAGFSASSLEARLSVVLVLCARGARLSSPACFLVT